LYLIFPFASVNSYSLAAAKIDYFNPIIAIEYTGFVFQYDHYDIENNYFIAVFICC